MKSNFFKDVHPFFFERAVNYVDVGAHCGEVFRSAFDSGIPIREAHLFEPNPTSFQALRRSTEGLLAPDKLVLHNVAVGDTKRSVKVRLADDMTQVLKEDRPGSGDQVVEVQAVTLDEASQHFILPRISILKIDVEGYELNVLNGAKNLFAGEAIDMLLIEAGLDPGSKQHCYYRHIEDFVMQYGCRLYRMYEQTPEWIDDSPVLRRVNLAFISPKFAKDNPYKLSRKFASLKSEHSSLVSKLRDLEESLKAQTIALQAAQQQAASEASALMRKISESEDRAKTAILSAEASKKELKVAKVEAASEKANLNELLAVSEAAAKEAFGRLQEYETSNAQLSRELKAARLKSSEHRVAQKFAQEKVRIVKNTLSYRLGKDLVEGGRSLTGALLLPLTLWRTNQHFKHSSKAVAPADVDGAVQKELQTSTQARRKAASTRLKLFSAMGSGDLKIRADQYLTWVGSSSYDQLLQDRDSTLRTYLKADNHFLASFAMMLLATRVSAFSVSVQNFERILEWGKLSELRSKLSRKAFERLLSDAATSLTRVGRYDEARALIDPYISQDTTALLRCRADMSWVRDPRLAIEDLSLLARNQKASSSDGLLLAHLMSLHEPDAKGSLSKPGHELVLANQNLAGSIERYWENLNGYLARQGIAKVECEAAETFDYKALRAPCEASPDQTLVTVVMTTFNAVETVDYAIQSILNQSHQALELIVVDDCSTDGTNDVLRRYEAADQRVKIIRNERNVGTYAGRNRALQVCAGDYITFHDADDWAHPQRIQVHLATMRDNPEVAATRSEWLRIGSNGGIAMRRWGKKFQHANPASVFFHRDLLEKVGYFDSVRFGADSEFWFRVQKALGRQRVMTIQQCLAFGLLHDRSLTQSGAGAMSEENFSPVRSDYCYSYTLWHAASMPSDLRMPANPEERPFWAPEVMLSAGTRNSLDQPRLGARFAEVKRADGPSNLVFGISLASATVTKDWKRTCLLLSNTLHSLLQQTDGRFSVIIVGHERPSITELDDIRVTFVECDTPPPKDPAGYRKDKMQKRRWAGALLREIGGGYFFPLDADDLVHKNFVRLVLEEDNHHGYLIDRGYALDFNEKRVAPVEEVWDSSYDRVCGSSAAIYFSTDELPTNGAAKDPGLYFNLFQSHAYWPNTAREFGRPLKRVPFPAGVYVVNHSQNLSFGLQRAGVRAQNIISAIEHSEIEKGLDILVEDFAFRKKTLG